MKNVIYSAVAVVMFLGITSCGTQKKLEACQANYQLCIEDAARKNSEIASLQSKLEGSKDQLDLLKSQNASLQNALENCTTNSGQSSTNIQKLIDQIQSSNAYIKRLTDARFRQDSLNLALSNKLKKSLDNLNDEDVDVKVLKGVVFISLSDKMLYKSGSYDILPSAEAVLAKVAKVINDYQDYDVMVEGHTDSNPISTKFIKDNWDLSALRATSVVRALQNKFNVDPARMTAGGRSEFVPKADNQTPQGRSENRRTEIIIMPKLDEFMKLMDIKEQKTNL